ncbi:MAG TPA: ribonuclease P protein component [Cyclobacteriaceae bacterium]|nr:ribonuclease P protein component [Cyclobacteriaceae bacterium]
MKNSERELSLSFGEGPGVRFKKNERLSKEKWIQELFEKGSSFYLSPFKIIYLKHPDSTLPNQILISVPSRQFKKAVDRNLIKRRIREAYRTQKSNLTQPLIFAIVYTAKEILPFSEVKTKILIALTKLSTLSTPPPSSVERGQG